MVAITLFTVISVTVNNYLSVNNRTNEDRLQPTQINYNQIHNVEDISGSGGITEPVTLQEMKDYLRLEGFADDGSGITPEAPIELTLLEAATTVTSALLIGKSILSLTRSGTTMYEADSFVVLNFLFDDATGIITFENAGNVGGEPIGILYGEAGTSSGNVFGFDDAIIESQTTEARMWVEKFTGVHVVPKSLEVTLTCGAGYMRIPGPVTGTISIVDKNGLTITGTEFIGTLFPKIVTTFSDRMVMTYTAGYGTDCPEWVKGAIKAYVADHYEFRGDDKPEAPNERAAMICRPHRRLTLWG